MIRTHIWKLPAAGLLLLGVLNADDQHHHDLGSVHFPVSCTPAAQKTFDHGVALLHSFWYDEAEKTFSEVTRACRNSRSAGAKYARPVGGSWGWDETYIRVLPEARPVAHGNGMQVRFC